MVSLGKWLKRKWGSCATRMLESQARLSALPYTSEYLQEQWDAQVSTQTLPLPRASQTAGQRAIQAILALADLGASFKKELRALDKKLDTQSFVDPLDLQDALAIRDELLNKISDNVKAVATKKKGLGIESERSLKRLLSDKYLLLKVNAQALKSRIRSKLQGRKFELERIDKAARHGASETKLRAHVQSQIDHHQPGITKLVVKYNDIVTQMAEHIRLGKAPKNSICPKFIDRKNLFQLDIDSDIWHDVGLHEGEVNAPPWLKDDEVRAAIQAHLQIERCMEQQQWLSFERHNLQIWAVEQLEAFDVLEKAALGKDFDYQFGRRKTKLQECIVEWRRDVTHIPLPGGIVDTWGLEGLSLTFEGGAVLNVDEDGVWEDEVESDVEAEGGDEMLELSDLLEVTLLSTQPEELIDFPHENRAGYSGYDLLTEPGLRSPAKRMRLELDE
jgi:hypothetical protein